MRIDISNFGNSLLSRPIGREAALALISNVLRGLPKEEAVELDFSNILVLTPSWTDEFLTVLRADYSGKIKVIPGTNASVLLTMETIGEKLEN